MTISSKLFATQMLDQFKFIENRLQNLNTQIATGTRLTQSSDAPLDAVTLTARSELEARLEQFQSNAASMSRKKQEERYNELALENQQLQREQQSRMGAIQVESQRVIDSLIAKVKDRVKEYGKNNGYTYIYGANDAGSVMFGADDKDLTDAILEVLNTSSSTQETKE